MIQRGMAQVAEHLPKKCKVQSSNSRTIKKKKKKKEKKFIYLFIYPLERKAEVGLEMQLSGRALT
jgi:hypothetical protein